MTPETIKAIKTVSGGIFHGIVLYKERELCGRDWEILCSHLKISTNTIHSLTAIPNGFVLTTKSMSFKYLHENFSCEKRVVEIRY